MTRCVNLRPHEALAAKDGRLTCLVRPVAKPVHPLATHAEPRSRNWWIWMVDTGRSTAFAASDQRCPLGAPGDVLLGREAFFVDHVWYLTGPLPREVPLKFNGEHTYYRADGECCAQIPECDCAETGPVLWRPAQHMPAWAARHSFTVESVRGDRVRHVTDEECQANGLERIGDLWWMALAAQLRLDIEDWCWIARVGRAA